MTPSEIFNQAISVLTIDSTSEKEYSEATVYLVDLLIKASNSHWFISANDWHTKDEWKETALKLAKAILASKKNE